MDKWISKSSIIFVIVLTICTATLYFLNKDALQYIIFVPAMAAVIATLLSKRKWREFGWKFSLKWTFIAWFIPILYSALAYGIIWLFKLGEVPNPLFIERAKMTIGLQTDSAMTIVILAFFYITIVMLIPATIMALGEELGWRGFLFPELNKTLNFNKAAFYSSFIWALWHLPGILQGNYGEQNTPMTFRIIMFLLMVMFTGYLLSWIWYKSKSVFAVAVFHACHNGVIQMFFDRLTLDTQLTPYFKGEFGMNLVLTTAATMIVVLLFLNKSKASLKT